jgi:alcohol dehydrogenase (NADP+)
LDLLLIHWPEAWVPGSQDPDTGVSIEETWRAMEGLVEAGKVRHLGVANFSLAQVERLSTGELR